MERANYVARKIVQTALSLRAMPLRGSYPPELLAIGVRDYRQVFFKPYRILYKVRAETVHIGLISDGRRDMQSLLTRRLLG